MIVILLLSAWLGIFQNSFQRNDALGTWLTPGDDAAKVLIYRNGDKYFGKILWLQIPVKDGKPRTDEKNSDAARRNDPVLGMVLLRDFVWDEDDQEWNSGTVYDPKSGNTYSGYLKLMDKDRLKLRGYIGVSLIGRTEYWTRVK